MKRLVSEEAIEKYQQKEVSVQGRTYRTIFRFTDTMAGDTHAYEVGFVHQGEETTRTVYLPSITKEGLLQKNRTLWYPVSVLIPPLHFRQGRRFYLNGLVNDNRFASALSDFYPDLLTMKPGIKTPLYYSLYSDEPVDVKDLQQWIVLDMASAVLELYNLKIVQDIHRSQRGGFKGISATVQSLHTLIRAFSRYYGKDDECLSGNEHVLIEDETILGRRIIESRKNNLLIHPLIHDIDITGDCPVDFTGCSQSHPFTTAQIKDGIVVHDHHLTSRGTFPYARSRRDTIGIMNNDPRRMIVARSTSRAMVLDSPDAPYAETEFTSKELDSLSLPGVRMTHPLNYEDGIVVSRTFAEKAGAYKLYADRFTVPGNSTVILLKEPYAGEDHRAIARDALWGTAASSCTIYRGDRIAVVVTDTDATPIEVTTRIRHVSALVKVERFTPATDLAEDAMVYQLTSITHLPLTVGDKVSDAHGNKATVSAILPDEDMPLWEDTRCHYIASPYIMKRLAVGAEIEDKLALIGRRQRDMGEDCVASLDSAEVISLKEVNEELARYSLSYTGRVRFQGRSYNDVPISLRKMFRLDNNAIETVSTRTGIAIVDGRRESRNIKLGLELLTFMARGAHNLTAWLISESSLREYTARHVLPLLYSFRDQIPENAQAFVISRKLPGELLGRPKSLSAFKEYDLTNTSCDERMNTHYGIIQHGKRTIIIPPHDPSCKTGMGYVTVGTIAIAANRIIAEVLSEKAVGKSLTDVAGKIDQYKSGLSTILTGKGGRIQEAVTPVFPTSIRAVASPYLSNDPFEIALPEREYRRLMRASSEIREIYGSGKNLCILKRDPVHRSWNVIGVRFTLWKNATIGINPVIIRSLDADYDGDIVVAMLPCNDKAYADIGKLIPDFDEIFSASKQIYDAVPDNAIELLKDRIGWTGTFENPHTSDILHNEALFARLTSGMNEKELSEECINAVRDFETIKTGTALTGALALRFIYSRHPADTELVHAACELYHTLAQDTLDAKSGKAVSSLKIVDAFNKGKGSEIESLLRAMGFTHDRCIEALKSFCGEVRASGSMGNYLREHFPVLASIQRNAGQQECRVLVDRILSGNIPDTGIWEKLFAYSTGSKELTSLYHPT